MYNYLKGVFYLQSACELEVFLFAKICRFIVDVPHKLHSAVNAFVFIHGLNFHF